MIDWLIQVGLSNAFFASLLACVAIIVGTKAKRPQLAHLLWVLVLVKIVTPPLMTFPISLDRFDKEVRNEVDNTPVVEASDFLADVALEEKASFAIPEIIAHPTTELPASSWNSKLASGFRATKTWFVSIWILVCGVLFLRSIIRVTRFHKLLRNSMKPAPASIIVAADRIGRQLGLLNTPSISTTSANLSPLVWWVGGVVHLILPQSLLDESDEECWECVLAHELAHVRRRDYLVRWLEWAACVLFWWNPIVWWAQRNLRAAEEVCCDQLVLARLNPNAHTYAESMLATVEILAGSAIRPPAMASEMNSGGLLERRIEMILSGRLNQTSRTVQCGALALALLFLPFGIGQTIGQAEDSEAVKKRLLEAVENDEITFEQAARMMKALEGEPHQRDATGPERKFRAIEAEVVRAVEEGKITREQAEQKLEAVKRDLWGAKHDNHKPQGDEREKKFHAAIVEIEKAVESGRISHEDAEKKMHALKQELWSEKRAEGEHAKRREAEEAFHRAELELKSQVENGRMTRQQAESRLRELKFHLATELAPMELKKHYEREEKETKRLILAGEISLGDAEKRLEDLRRQIWEKSQRRDPHPSENEEALKRRIKEAVEAGKISHADAEKAMSEIERRMKTLRDERAKIEREKSDLERRDTERRDSERKVSDPKDNVRRDGERAVAPVDSNVVKMYVSKKGIYYQGQSLKTAQIENLLTELLRKHPKYRLEITAEQDTPYQRVIIVMDVANKVGWENISLRSLAEAATDVQPKR